MSSVPQDTLKVALIQSDIAWLQVEQNLSHFAKQLSSLSGYDLILLPETFATGFAVECDIKEPHQGPIFQWLARQAQALNSVVGGSVLVSHKGKKFNRFYCCWPNHEFVFYDKRHLVCLGKEGDFIDPGASRTLFNIKGFNFLPQVCYDLRFPVFQRNQGDYDVMINIANWPATRRSHWDTLLAARAIENQSYVLAVNRIGTDGNGIAHDGGTQAFDYKGKLITQVADHHEGVCTVTLHKKELQSYRHKFPAHRDADPFTLG